MATKKTAGEAVETVETVEAQETKTGSAWDVWQDITLPRAHSGEEKFVAVWVNGRGYQVPKGKTVSVPLPIYERLKIMQQMEEMAEEYREEIEAENGRVTRI